MLKNLEESQNTQLDCPVLPWLMEMFKDIIVQVTTHYCSNPTSGKHYYEICQKAPKVVTVFATLATQNELGKSRII